MLPSPNIHQESQNLDRAVNYPYTIPTTKVETITKPTQEVP